MQKNSEMQNQDSEQNKFFRFQVFQGDEDQNGKIQKTKSVGMAYLKNGHQTFTIRLWMFLSERFYMIQNRNDASRYLVMTREPNKSPNSKNKYFWNIVGNGVADSLKGIIKIEFDLLDKPIYMNIHPETSAFSTHLPEPEFFEQDAA